MTKTRKKSPKIRHRRGPVGVLRKRLRAGLRLTHGERLLLYRRAMGYSQQEMADVYGVSLDRLRLWEDDTERDDMPKAPKVLLTELSLSELLFVHRRRRGIPMREIATVFGRGISWVWAASAGGPGAHDVVAYVLTK